MGHRLLYLFNHNYAKELTDYEAGKVPRHRLFGLVDVREAGHTPSLCPLPQNSASRLSRPVFWRVYQAVYALRNQNRFDCLIATHEASALPILLLKKMGLLRTPVIVINVALLHPKNTEPRKQRLWKFLLPKAERILSYCSAQIPWISEELGIPTEKLGFIPLCVDTKFFHPEPAEAPEKPYCLSVGTNEGKDYATLVRALPPGIPLKIVTDGMNAQVVEETRSPGQEIEVLQNVPIETLRKFYREAYFHVIPLHDSRFSSGQTVLLENMALGKVVLTSHVSSVLDYVEAGKTALTVPSGDVEALARSLAAVWQNREHYRPIGENAARRVDQNFSSTLFAQRLLAEIEPILRRRSKANL